MGRVKPPVVMVCDSATVMPTYHGEMGGALGRGEHSQCADLGLQMQVRHHAGSRN
jgi:hypothetical protein